MLAFHPLNYTRAQSAPARAPITPSIHPVCAICGSLPLRAEQTHQKRNKPTKNRSGAPKTPLFIPPPHIFLTKQSQTLPNTCLPGLKIPFHSPLPTTDVGKTGSPLYRQLYAPMGFILLLLFVAVLFLLCMLA